MKFLVISGGTEKAAEIVAILFTHRLAGAISLPGTPAAKGAPPVANHA